MTMTNNTKNKLRIAAISDIHVSETSQGIYQTLFAQISQKADVIVFGGDFTNYGKPEEEQVLAAELQALTIPKLGVLGNHDHESGKSDEIRKILKAAGMYFLDEQEYDMHGVGFAGVKGFGGGFGQHMLSYFGEAENKAYVQAALEEVKKLEIVLGGLAEQQKKVVVMHYSPIVETIKGEPAEIYPFLGATRFEEVIDRFNVAIVFHGHAHFGSLVGKTGKGAIVYNVALPIMKKLDEKNPYRIVEL